jgi:hypothetical protein
MGIKFITCFRHADNGEPVEIRNTDPPRRGKIFFGKDADGKIVYTKFTLRILSEEGELLEPEHRIAFDEQGQGRIIFPDHVVIESVEDPIP